MDIEVTRLSPAIGAEVHDIDLADDLNGLVKSELLTAFHAHSVLLLRGQKLTGRELILGAIWLGALDGQPRPQRGGNGAIALHHDTAFQEKPHKVSFLYAAEAPSTGGEMLFANMYRAYQLVPPAVKEKLAGRTALQVGGRTTTEKPQAAEPHMTAGRDHGARFSHPVFVTHPATGRKALYVSRLTTASIDGMESGESDAVLEQLFACAEDPAIVYRHVLCPGDFIAWDNLSASHAETGFPADGGGKLLRGATIGARPRE